MDRTSRVLMAVVGVLLGWILARETAVPARAGAPVAPVQNSVMVVKHGDRIAVTANSWLYVYGFDDATRGGATLKLVGSAILGRSSEK